MERMRRLRSACRIVRRRHRHAERGATAVEFALVAPVFFLLIFAILEFGWYFFVEHTIQYATREGTRLALVGVQLNDPGGNPMSREDSIISTIHNSAALAVDPDDLSISIFPVGSGYADPEGWEEIVNAGAGGDYMRVRTQYTYTFITPFIRAFFPGGERVITASTLFRNELF